MSLEWCARTMKKYCLSGSLKLDYSIRILLDVTMQYNDHLHRQKKFLCAVSCLEILTACKSHYNIQMWMSGAEIGVAAISVDLLFFEYWSKLKPVMDLEVFDFIMECLVCYISRKHYNCFKFL